MPRKNKKNPRRRLGAKEIRIIGEEEAKALSRTVRRRELFFILEDIVDTYNVGGFFRLAEALAAKKVYLCGRTSTPPNPKIIKASVGNYKLVPWDYKKTAGAAIRELKKTRPDLLCVAIEQSQRSRDYKKISYRYPLAFVLGSERSGIKTGTLKLVDAISEIPMYGLNSSLNVIVAAGVVAYFAVETGVKATSKTKTKTRQQFDTPQKP